jgi:hypothetical protein
LYGRPLAALFLPEPPEEAPQEAQFRRLPGAPAPPWPPAMHLLARHAPDLEGARRSWRAVVPTNRWHRTMPGICQHFSVPCCTLSGLSSHAPQPARATFARRRPDCPQQRAERDPRRPLNRWRSLRRRLGVGEARPSRG